MKAIIILAGTTALLLVVFAVAQQPGSPSDAKAPPTSAGNRARVMGCCPGCTMSSQRGDMRPAAAVYTCPMHPAVRSNTAGGCPMCGMAMTQKTGPGPAMMKHMRVLMQTPIFLDSPYAIHGQAADLGLSEKQKKKLIEIENEARKKAVAVLTSKQRKKMGDIPDKPLVMTQMCQQMCARMAPMMHKMAGKGGPMMMCPMMQMMSEQAAPSSPSIRPAK